MNGATFGFALVGFIIVAALIEQYDEGHKTGYLTWYTLLILLTFLTAHRGALAGEVSRINSMFTGAPTNRATGTITNTPAAPTNRATGPIR